MGGKVELSHMSILSRLGLTPVGKKGALRTTFTPETRSRRLISRKQHNVSRKWIGDGEYRQLNLDWVRQNPTYANRLPFNMFSKSLRDKLDQFKPEGRSVVVMAAPTSIFFGAESGIMRDSLLDAEEFFDDSVIVVSPLFKRWHITDLNDLKIEHLRDRIGLVEGYIQNQLDDIAGEVDLINFGTLNPANVFMPMLVQFDGETVQSTKPALSVYRSALKENGRMAFLVKDTVDLKFIQNQISGQGFELVARRPLDDLRLDQDALRDGIEPAKWDRGYLLLVYRKKPMNPAP